MRMTYLLFLLFGTLASATAEERFDFYVVKVAGKAPTNLAGFKNVSGAAFQSGGYLVDKVTGKKAGTIVKVEVNDGPGGL